jgi:transcriptional regulator of acetoin/glycerol metabolism
MDSLTDRTFTLKEIIEDVRADVIRRRLVALNWDFEAAAKSLGISRKTLWELRLKYGIQK